MQTLSNGMTPEEWLKFNYGLHIGNRIVMNKRTGVLVNVIKRDNIGHFRTNYPVVLCIDYLTEDVQRITIEEIYKYRPFQL